MSSPRGWPREYAAIVNARQMQALSRRWTREKREREKESGELRNEFLNLLARSLRVPLLPTLLQSSVYPLPKIFFLKEGCNNKFSERTNYPIVGCSLVLEIFFFFFFLSGNNRNAFDSFASFNRFIGITRPGTKTPNWKLGMGIFMPR